MSASVGADVRIGRRRCPQRSAQMSASVDADVRNGRRRCPQRSARMYQGAQWSVHLSGGAAVSAAPTKQSAHFLLGWRTSCLVGALLGWCTSWLVHLRQVHPLSVPPWCPLGKAKCTVVVLAYAELAVDKAHELHSGEEAEAAIRLAVDSVVEDVAQTLLAHAELRDEDIVAA